MTGRHETGAPARRSTHRRLALIPGRHHHAVSARVQGGGTLQDTQCQLAHLRPAQHGAGREFQQRH